MAMQIGPLQAAAVLAGYVAVFCGASMALFRSRAIE
jgi:hypothetical protein